MGGDKGRGPWEQGCGCCAIGGTISAPLLWLKSRPLGPSAYQSRYLRQEGEVSVQNGTVGAMEKFQDVLSQELEGIGRSQGRKEFLLLRLVV